jgi:hypothetical protein
MFFSRGIVSVIFMTAVFCCEAVAQDSLSSAGSGPDQKPRSSIQLPQDWDKKDVLSELPVFINRKGEEMESISIVDHPTPTSAQAPVSVAAFKKQLEKTVNFHGGQAGVQEWKVNSVDVLAVPKGKLFKVRGTYLGAASQRVYFEEWKYYLDRGFAQVTFSEEGKKEPSDPSTIEALLKKFAPYGESL